MDGANRPRRHLPGPLRRRPFGWADISRRSTDQPDIFRPFQLEYIQIPTAVLLTLLRPPRSYHGISYWYSSTKSTNISRKDIDEALALALLQPRFKAQTTTLWRCCLAKKSRGRTTGDKRRRRHDMRLSFKKDGLSVPCRAPIHHICWPTCLFYLFLACDVGTWWPLCPSPG